MAPLTSSSSSRPRALVAWSSGKDSAYALHVARQGGAIDVVGLLTTITDGYARVSMHGVRESILRAQADRVGLPLTTVRIPATCANEVYERAIAAALAEARAAGVSHVVFGDLFLADLRAWRTARLAEVGMEAVFPLWQRDTAALAREMIAAGIEAQIVCLDPRHLDRSLAGRRLDTALLDALPPGVDPCGENGEFHTVVTAGPMFAAPIPTRLGEIVERDGFVFADVLPL